MSLIFAEESHLLCYNACVAPRNGESMNPVDFVMKMPCGSIESVFKQEANQILLIAESKYDQLLGMEKTLEFSMTKTEILELSARLLIAGLELKDEEV